MDSLVWPTAKAQLYLVEAAEVKKKVGRDRIHRNKDVLRELRCLQEILAEVHSGALGDVHSADERWRSLQEAGLPTDWVSPVVQRFLLARSALPCCPASERAASSTRATSTPEEVPEEVRSVVRQKGWLSREQLERLANVLREQLDQEHTSLLASIDEVQALLEAEVRLPRAELDAFVAAADEALSAAPCWEMCSAGTRWADMVEESVERPRNKPPVRAQCGTCRLWLGRKAFSRRAWQQARPSSSEALCFEAEASCLACRRDHHAQ